LDQGGSGSDGNRGGFRIRQARVLPIQLYSCTLFSRLDISSNLEDEDDKHTRHKRKKQDLETAPLKTELRSLLSQPLLARGISAKFITSGSRPVADTLMAGECTYGFGPRPVLCVLICLPHMNRSRKNIGSEKDEGGERDIGEKEESGGPNGGRRMVWYPVIAPTAWCPLPHVDPSHLSRSPINISLVLTRCGIQGRRSRDYDCDKVRVGGVTKSPSYHHAQGRH
jgi:hypothetical protein